MDHRCVKEKQQGKNLNTLYKKWMFTCSIADEMAYRKYRAMFRKVAIEAQNSSEMFNSKTNSIKKLWENLNTVCSFKKNS